MRAAKKLITSKGVVAAGGIIPDGLGKEEADRIKSFGGFAPEVTKAPVAPVAADEPSRAEKIAAIIEMLADDEFGKDGKPKVDAINAALEEGDDPATAEERDAVWASMEEE